MLHHQNRMPTGRMKTRYDLMDNSIRFQGGNLLWFCNSRRRKSRCPNLSAEWEDPNTIVARINDVVYRIRRGPKKKTKIVHLGRLMKYNSDTVDVSDGCSLEKCLEAEFAMDSKKTPIAAQLERSMGLNRGHLRERFSRVEFSEC